jgi:HSP20 family protein
MSIIKYEPWSLLKNVQSELNQIFSWDQDHVNKGEPIAHNFPEIDIEDTGNQYQIDANLPGVDPKNIQIHLNQDDLTIKGTISKTQEKKDKNYIRCERVFGSFTRTLRLPNADQEAEINAVYKNGVLSITVPKIKTKTARQIQIKS